MMENKAIIARDTTLAKIENSLLITNKILFSEKESLFNEAFYLMNSADENLERSNFLFFIENNKDYIEDCNFKFNAKSDVEYKQAIKLFVQILKLDYNFKFALIFKGIAYYKIEKYNLAFSDFTRVLLLDSEYLLPYYWRGMIYYDGVPFYGGSPDKAISDFNKLISTNYNKVEILLCMGISKFAINDYLGAIEDFTQVINLNPLSGDAFCWRGESKIQLFDYKSAAQDYYMGKSLGVDHWVFNTVSEYRTNSYVREYARLTFAIEQKPEDPYPHYVLGCLYRDLNDYESAILEYNISIEISGFGSDVSLIYMSRAHAKYKSKDYKGAINDYQMAIDEGSNNIWGACYLYMGEIQYELKNYSDASRNFFKAIENDYELNEIYESYYWLGKINFDLKKLDGAILNFSKAINYNPDYVDAFLNRGLARYELNDIMGSIEDYDKVIELDKKNIEAYKNRIEAKARLGKICEIEEDLKIYKILTNNAN